MAADDDAEVFEITDFTTASEWERFISRVEEILHEWKLVGCCPKPPAPKGAYTGGIWEERVEELSFADFKFCMVHHWLRCDDEKSEKAREKETDQDDDKEEKTPTVYGDLLNMENDFPSRAHCLCRWYGVQDFLILSPALDIEAILSESKVKLLLSSVSIALSEAGCYVPVFVQVHQKWRRLYHGTCVLPGSSVEFGMVHLKRAPPQYSHLAGLLDVFKAKQCSMAEQRPPVSVAVRFLYMLYDWVNSPWTQPLPDFDDEVGCTGFDNLPFGACEDPVSALQLYCTWPSLSEDMIVENQVYSDLDPLQAPLWSVKIQMTEDPQCLLGEYLIHFLALCHRKETLDQLIGSLASSTADAESGADISQALHKLTEPSMGYTIPSFSAYVPTSQKHKARDSAIPGEMLDDILQYLFPDSKTCLDKSEEQSEPSSTVTEHSESYRQMEKDLSKQLKSSPTDSVLHRLAVCMCILNQNNDYGGFGAVAQIWSEFVLEMRYRWENKYNIVGIEKGPPNLGTCILQQKLQMLNCCIEHKKKREQLHKGYTGETTYYSGSSDFGPSTSRISRTFSDEGDEEDEAGGAGDAKGLGSSSDTDDEFFECDNDEQTSEKVSENLTEEKEIDESAADHSDDSADNQSNSMEVSSENVQNQSQEMTGIDTDNQSRLEQQAESENQSEMAESCDNDNDLQRRTSSQNRSIDGAEKVSRPGSVAGSQPRDSISNVSMQSDSAFQESFTHKPEGRLAPFQDLTLVNCNEKMYIPITQEPAPMTEDMLEEHAEVLAKVTMTTVGLTHWADILTVILYFVFVLGVGIWSIWKRKRGNVENYFLAGRSMPWIAVGASIFGSNIGSEHFIGLAGAGAASGIVLILFEWIPALIIQVLSWLFLPVYISAGVYTLPEYMGKRFGGKRLRTYLSLLSLFLHILTRLSTTIFSGAIYIQLALGWDMYPSIIGVLFVTGIFTIAGGLTAVMYTDTAQSVIIVIGAFLVMGLSLDKIGGYQNLIPAYMNATPTIRDTNTTCGLPRSDAMSVLRDPATGDFPWTAMLLQCSLVSSWYWICDQVMVQRCLAAKNITHAKSGTLLGGYLKILPLFIMIIPGMISRVLYTDEVACADPDECMRVCKNPVGCSNIAYPRLVLGILPDGARGLIMAAMLSAIVTSLTSIFNSSSTVFTMDFWRRVRPDANQRELLIVGRVYIVILCLVTILWIPVVQAAEGGQLFSYMVIFEGFIAAPLPVLFILAIFWKRTTEMGAFYGLAITHVIGVIRLILEIVHPVPGCGEPDTRPAILSKVHGFYFSQLMMLIELILVVGISLLTKQNTEEELHGTTYYTKLEGNIINDDQNQDPGISTILANDIIQGTENIELSTLEREQIEVTEDFEQNFTEIHNNPKEVLVADNTNNPRHVRRKFTTTKFTTTKISRLFLKLCGVPDSSANTAVDISIESRKSFLTETSELTENINMGLAITLLFIVTFLVGYYH